MDTEWNPVTKHIVGVGLAIFAVFILYISRPVLTIFVIAALVAFLLMPLVDLLNNRARLPRGVAVLLAYLFFTVLLLLAPLVFLPPVIDGFNSLAKIDYRILVDGSLTWLEQSLTTLQNTEVDVLGLQFDFAPVVEPALETLQDRRPNLSAPPLPSLQTAFRSLTSAVTFTYGFATNVAGTVFSGLLTFIITLLSAIYISLDAHKFKRWFLQAVPDPYRPEFSELLNRLRKTWRAYLRGQLNLMVIIGLVTWLGNMAIGLPGAFALGVIAGILELIPNLGPFLAAVPAVVVALIQGSTYLGVGNLVFMLIVIGLYVLIQQLENTLVVPRVLGEAVDLHPLVVMMGVVVGASFAGILGALLAAPVIASVRVIVNYLYAKIMGTDPFPADEQEPEEIKFSLLEQTKGLVDKGRALLRQWQAASPEAEAAEEDSQDEQPGGQQPTGLA